MNISQKCTVLCILYLNIRKYPNYHVLVWETPYYFIQNVFVFFVIVEIVLSKGTYIRIDWKENTE